MGRVPLELAVRHHRARESGAREGLRKGGTMGLFSKVRAAQRDIRPVRREGVHLPGGAKIEVKGESHYQEALSAACGGKCEEGHDLPVVAVLVPEPHNKYDANAVQVCVSGRVVGYLSRAAAASYAPVLRSTNATMTCDARINGGWSRGGGDEGSFGIVLDLAAPAKLGL